MMPIIFRFLMLLFVMMGLSSALAQAQERGAGLTQDTKIIGSEPDWDNPRKVMLQITSNDPAHVNNVYYNAINLQKFYGQDNVKVSLIFYGPGVRALLKESAIAPERVKALQDYDVEFVACNNTLTTLKKTPDDLLPNVRVVTSGIAEIIEKRLDGWHYIIP
jgi:uncharacterized protein